jgi:hypothetical protein
MTAVEVVILVVAVLVAVGAIIGIGSSGFFSGGEIGHRSIRGRLRSSAERDSIERDHHPSFYAPQGGHHPEPPGTRKPPHEGGLL